MYVITNLGFIMTYILPEIPLGAPPECEMLIEARNRLFTTDATVHENLGRWVIDMLGFARQVRGLPGSVLTHHSPHLASIRSTVSTDLANADTGMLVYNTGVVNYTSDKVTYHPITGEICSVYFSRQKMQWVSESHGVIHLSTLLAEEFSAGDTWEPDYDDSENPPPTLALAPTLYLINPSVFSTFLFIMADALVAYNKNEEDIHSGKIRPYHDSNELYPEPPQYPYLNANHQQWDLFNNG